MADNKLKSLNEMFNESFFRIPDFQRGFSWGEDQLTDFWEDLLNLKDHHTHYTGLITVEPLDKADLLHNERWQSNKHKYKQIFDYELGEVFAGYTEEVDDLYRRLESGTNTSWKRTSMALLPTVLMATYNLPVSAMDAVFKLLVGVSGGVGMHIVDNVSERGKILEKSDFAFSFYLKNLT